jgi:4-methylaminobutanoate oxidase (formaldehyde-forming)
MGYVRRPHGVTPEWIAATRFEVGVGDRRIGARAQLGPWYDPKNERVKG